MTAPAGAGYPAEACREYGQEEQDETHESNRGGP